MSKRSQLRRRIRREVLREQSQAKRGQVPFPRVEVTNSDLEEFIRFLEEDLVQVAIRTKSGKRYPATITRAEQLAMYTDDEVTQEAVRQRIFPLLNMLDEAPPGSEAALLLAEVERTIKGIAADHKRRNPDFPRRVG